jgi:hypothetical protein
MGSSLCIRDFNESLQIVLGFVSSVSPGPAPTEKWQQVYVEVTENATASVEANGLLAPSATVDHDGSFLFQLIPNRFCKFLLSITALDTYSMGKNMYCKHVLTCPSANPILPLSIKCLEI